MLWDMAANDFIKYDINVLLNKHIGYCHLPPKKGDPVYMMSFIGHDICNLRAKGDILAEVIKLVYPSDFIKARQKSSPINSPTKKQAPSVDVPNVSQYDDLYSDSEESEKSVEDQVQAAMEVADHLHADSLSVAQKVAEAFDTC